jgi:hypothetical protein
LECRIYKHTVGRDTFIGGTNGTIESLLAEGAGGGQQCLSYVGSIYHVTSPPPLAITRDLLKNDARGNQTRTQTIVEFTIMAIPTEAPDAAGLNMEQAVAQGRAAFDHMKSVQSSVDPIQEAINTSATVINNIKSVSDTWGPLLQKIKLFSELVDAIVEVRD